MFGLARPQATRAADMLKILGEEWRELVAGREGFLTGKKRAGLVRQRVVWGEMDCMVCLYFPPTLSTYQFPFYVIFWAEIGSELTSWRRLK